MRTPPPPGRWPKRTSTPARWRRACSTTPSAEASPRRLLEALVTPEPLVPPDTVEAQGLQALECRCEVVDDVLGPILVGLGGDPCVENAAWRQRGRESIHGAHRIDQMFEDVHGGDQIE